MILNNFVLVLPQLTHNVPELSAGVPVLRLRQALLQKTPVGRGLCFFKDKPLSLL